jgi:hypothetical protein
MNKQNKEKKAKNTLEVFENVSKKLGSPSS